MNKKKEVYIKNFTEAEKDLAIDIIRKTLVIRLKKKSINMPLQFGCWSV